jgi:hypothetical protein
VSDTDFVGISRCGGLLYGVAAVAVACLCGFAVYNDPTIYLWITNSDQLTLPFLARDLGKDPSSWTGWQLSRAPYLFPDLVVAYIAYVATGTLAGTVYVALFLFYSCQLIALACVVSVVCPGAPAKSLLFAVLVWFLIPASLVAGNGDLTDRIVKYQFSIGTHFSALVIAASTIAIGIRLIFSPPIQISRRLGLLLALGLLSLLGAVSNKLFLAFGVIPIGVLAGYAVMRHRNYADTVNVLIALALGISLALLLDSQLNRQVSIPIARHSHVIFANAGSLAADVVRQITAGSMALRIWLVAAVLYLVAVPAYFFRRYRHQSKPNCSDSKLELLAIAFWSASAVSVGGSILTYAETPTWRYLVPFFYYPLLHFAAYVARNLTGLSHVSVVRRRATLMAAVALFGLQGVSLAGQASLSETTLQRDLANRANRLSDCVRDNGLHAGVASYWLAKHLTFFSTAPLSLLPLPPWDVSGGLFYWGTNAFDFFQRNNEPIIYDFVLVEGFAEGDVVRSYGKPSREITCGMGMLVYAYEDREAFFGKLVAGHPEIYLPLLKRDGKVTIPAAALLSQVGSIQGVYRAAAAPRDPQGYLIFGPYVSLQRGSYELVVRYSVESPGLDRAKAANYVDVSTRRGRAVITKMRMPGERGAHTLTVPFYLEQTARGAESRIWFSGTGTLTVRDITLIRVGS